MAAIERLLAPLRRRVRLMVSRAVVRLVDDGLKLQGVQLTLLKGETANGVERFQPYGLSGVPAGGAEAIALAVGGNREHLVAIAVDDRRHRPTGLAEGEVALYSLHGQAVKLLTGGKIAIGTDSTELLDLLDQLLAKLDELHTLLANLTMTGVSSGGQTSGVPSQKALIEAVQADIAAIKTDLGNLLQ